MEFEKLQIREIDISRAPVERATVLYQKLQRMKYFSPIVIGLSNSSFVSHFTFPPIPIPRPCILYFTSPRLHVTG